MHISSNILCTPILAIRTPWTTGSRALHLFTNVVRCDYLCLYVWHRFWHRYWLPCWQRFVSVCVDLRGTMRLHLCTHWWFDFRDIVCIVAVFAFLCMSCIYALRVCVDVHMRFVNMCMYPHTRLTYLWKSSWHAIQERCMHHFAAHFTSYSWLETSWPRCVQVWVWVYRNLSRGSSRRCTH